MCFNCVLFISTKDILSLEEDATPWISKSNTYKVQLYPHLHYIKGCCICIKPFTSQEQKIDVLGVIKKLSFALWSIYA